MMKHDLDHMALLVVDVQSGLDDPRLGPRNNPDCEANISRLIETLRASGPAVAFVRHDSVDPDSTLRRVQPGNDFTPILGSEPDPLSTTFMNEDGTVATVVMNPSEQEIGYRIFVGSEETALSIPARAMQTLVYWKTM